MPYEDTFEDGRKAGLQEVFQLYKKGIAKDPGIRLDTLGVFLNREVNQIGEARERPNRRRVGQPVLSEDLVDLDAKAEADAQAAEQRAAENRLRAEKDFDRDLQRAEGDPDRSVVPEGETEPEDSSGPATDA